MEYAVKYYNTGFSERGAALLEEDFNDMAGEGWEVVSVVNDGGLAWLVTFVREES